MRALAVVLMVVALTVLHPALMLVVALVAYAVGRKHRPRLPRGDLVKPEPIRTREERLAAPFG